MKRNRILQTICLLRDGDKVLLGMKKRGFGAGRWNGFGGKVHDGENIVEAAKREMFEECGIKVLDLEEKGKIVFEFSGKPDVPEVYIFKITKYQGKPKESEEMLPKWFNINKIPFKKMWPDDIFWFPLFLKDKNFSGYFLFGENDVIIKKVLFEEVIYNKLIRDRIPQIAWEDGWKAKTSKLGKTFIKEAKKKILEEAIELNEGKGKGNLFEELADIQEIIDAILVEEKVSLVQFRNIQKEKRKKRGGFKERLFLFKMKKEVNG